MPDPIYYRFTDEDVRADVTLVAAAMEYLKSYTGEFQPLLAAKDRYHSGMEFTVSQARMVLNCMRTDPRVEFMPVRRPVQEAIVIPFKPRAERAAARAKKPEPRQRQRLKVRWKLVYGYSVATGRSRRVHLLDTERSIIDYTPWDNSFDPRLSWHCGDHAMSWSRAGGDRSDFLRPLDYKIQLISVDAVYELLSGDDGWLMCPQCLAAVERKESPR